MSSKPLSYFFRLFIFHFYIPLTTQSYFLSPLPPYFTVQQDIDTLVKNGMLDHGKSKHSQKQSYIQMQGSFILQSYLPNILS